MSLRYYTNSRPMEQRGPILPMSKEDEEFWKLRKGEQDKRGWFRKWRG